MNIVVANSVGVDRNGCHLVHVPSRWSLGVKNFTNCSYYPWELAYTSSLLKRETPHRVKFLDGILHGWDFKAYFERLEQEQPDWLVMESSSRTWEEDRRLALAAKQAFGTRIIFAGQHPMAKPEEVEKTADHVCLGEYEFTVLDLIQGKDPRHLSGVHPNPRRDLPDINLLPFPEDDDVRRLDYHEPNCHFRQIQMYASRGCPRRCNFCVAATLYYDQLNWRPRHVDSVIGEIALLKEKYPEMEGVFFDEEVHNIRPSFNIALARAIRAAGLDGLKYEAMCEYASLDVEAMQEMKRAGYYKIRFGIETGSDEVARQMTLGRKHNPDKLKQILQAGKDLGLMFYGTISVGGLGSSEAEDRKTVDLIHELSSRGWLDEVQVSINTPQPGTDFHQSVKVRGWLREFAGWDAYDGNGHVCVDYPHYPAPRIQSMFRAALHAFDQGKQQAGARFLLPRLKAALQPITAGSRVLVLRCARPWMVSILLDGLVRHCGVQADLLAQDETKPAFQDHPSTGEVFSFGSGFFAAGCLSPDLLRKLQDRRYDWVLIPMANQNPVSYENVLQVARRLGGCRILGLFPNGESMELAADVANVEEILEEQVQEG